MTATSISSADGRQAALSAPPDAGSTASALPAWLQAMPLGARLRRLLHRPAACSTSSSASGTTTNTRSLPDFTTRSYIETFEGCCDCSCPISAPSLKTYLVDREILLHRLADHARLGFTIAYFLAFHVRSLTMQMVLFLDLHHSVLDLERHPHDLVDPAARPQRARQPGADRQRACRRQAGRMAALFSDFSVIARVRPPLHASS